MTATALDAAPQRPRAADRRALLGLLAAQAVSITGTRMSMVALPWFVLVTTGSPLRTGLVAFAEMLPYVVVAMVAAPVTDRVGARRTSVTCDVASTVVVASIPLLYASEQLSFPALLALVAVTGALRGPGDNAKHVVLPAAAERAGMPMERAVALYDGVNRTAGLVGAPLAGALIGIYGAAEVLAVDAATFAVAAGLLAATVPRGAVTRPAEDDGLPYLRRMLAGLALLGRDRLLGAIGLMLLVTNLLDQSFALLVTVWARDEGHGAAGVGLTYGVFGLGATVGTVVMVVVGPRLPRRVTFLVCFLVAGAPRFIAMAAGVPLGAVLAVAVVGGLAAGALNPILSAVELERMPEHLRARGYAALTALAFAGMPLGGLFGGWLASSYSGSAALAVCGGLYLLATLAPFGRSWGAMDRRGTGPTPSGKGPRATR